MSNTTTYDPTESGRIFGKIVLDFLQKDVPSEFGALLRGFATPFKLLFKSGVWIKDRFNQYYEEDSLEKTISQAPLIPASVRKLPQNSKKAVIFFKDQISTDFASLNSKERSAYLAKIGAYMVSIGGSIYLGNSVPDKDITMMGIGSHRNALFHSSLSACVLRLGFKLLERTIVTLEEENLLEDTPELREVKKCLILARGGAALGVGLHLVVDGGIENGKAVLFGDLGSLVNGTLLDDNAWLLVNGFVSILMGKEDITGDRNG